MDFHYDSRPVNEIRKHWLPIICIMAMAAITRIPGLLPPNFSAIYALAFCAGVYFPGRLAWWLPLATFIGTDLLLNLYYKFFHGLNTFDPATLMYLLANYAAYPVLIWLGRKFTKRAAFTALLGGGILGAILFYLITNTASWLFDPAYPKTLAGWIQALSRGTPGYPPTWDFFINTLTSGGLFTGLFAGAMKASEASQEAEEKETEEAEAEAPETEPEPEPSDSKA